VLDVWGDTFNWCDISDVSLSKIVHQSHLSIKSHEHWYDGERICYRLAHLNASTDVKWSICSDCGDHHGYHRHAVHVISHAAIANMLAQVAALQPSYRFEHTSQAVRHLP